MTPEHDVVIVRGASDGFGGDLLVGGFWEDGFEGDGVVHEECVGADSHDEIVVREEKKECAEVNIAVDAFALSGWDEAHEVFVVVMAAVCEVVGCGEGCEFGVRMGV